MSDPTQLIVPLNFAHRLMTHEGIVGRGRDLLTGSPCSLHSYIDISKRTYIMQLFQSLDSETLSSKMNSLAKYAHSSFLPNVIRPAFMATKKGQKASSYELAVFYQTSGIGQLTLQQLIAAKKKHDEKFQAQEITAFFWQMADFLFLSSRGSLQYLDLSPANILCKIEGHYGYNFFISNLGKKTINYHNPNDQFNKGTKNFETALSAAMFTFGLALLEISCLMPSSDLFQGGIINEKALSKRIEGVTITNDRMISGAIKQLLDLNEAKRLKPADIFKNEEWLKLRKVVYCPSKTDFFNFRNFEGILEYDKKTAIGESLDQELCMVRGFFTNGVLEGRGVREVKDSLEVGVFIGGELIEGQAIKKNTHIDVGKFKDGKIVQGMRLYLNVANLPKDSKTLNAFCGDFEGGYPKAGRRIFSDGSEDKL